MRHDVSDRLLLWELWHPWHPSLQITLWESVAKQLRENPDHEHGSMLAAHFAEKRNLPEVYPYPQFRLLPQIAPPAPGAVSVIKA